MSATAPPRNVSEGAPRLLLLVTLCMLLGCGRGRDREQLTLCPPCEDRVLSLIDSANTSLFLATSSLTHRRVLDAVLDAHYRGVQVEITLERDQQDLREHGHARRPSREPSVVESLVDAGVSCNLAVVALPALIVVVDGTRVVVGDVPLDATLRFASSLLLMLHSADTARALTTAVSAFAAGTQPSSTTQEDADFEISFGPIETVLAPLLDAVGAAHHEIRGADSNPLAPALVDALAAAHDRGVIVDLSLAYFSADRPRTIEQFRRLRERDVGVRLLRTRWLPPALVIDDTFVLTWGVRSTHTLVRLRSPHLAREGRALLTRVRAAHETVDPVEP